MGFFYDDRPSKRHYEDDYEDAFDYAPSVLTDGEFLFLLLAVGIAAAYLIVIVFFPERWALL